MNRERRLFHLTELLSSSDSSDEEMELLILERAKKPRLPRAKIRNYIRDVVSHYTEEQFKEHFRVERTTCHLLVQMFRRSKYFPKGIRRGRPLETAEKHILSFLWFSGNKTVIRSVSDRFNVTYSAMHRMLTRVMNFLVALAPNVIRFPSTEDENNALAYNFQQISGFPGVIGCIDGTYIEIKTPAHKLRTTYTNRHDKTSITLQGICDHQRRFLDVFTGIPSKIHDSRVFKLSFIKNNVKQLGPNFHLLGDAAYPLLENLLTPFRDYGDLTPTQRNYNYKFCATRVRIENAFGILKARFRQLSKLDIHSVLRLSKFIISCCVLHNICIDQEDFFEEVQEILPQNEEEFTVQDSKAGMVKRNQIADILFQ